MNAVLLLIFIVLTLASHGHACMAMVPTDPSIRNPPRVTTSTTTTTTAAPRTTTEATTTITLSTTPSTTTTTPTTTTAPPLPCTKCPGPKYMAVPLCDEPGAGCDANFLMTVQAPCVAATCVAGSTMIGTKEGKDFFGISKEGIRCREDGITFEDLTDPLKTFPAATGTVVCVKTCSTPPLGNTCTDDDLFDGRCSEPLGSDMAFLECTTGTLVINDIEMPGTVQCAKGVYTGPDGKTLPVGFTAHCKENPEATSP